MAGLFPIFRRGALRGAAAMPDVAGVPFGGSPRRMVAFEEDAWLGGVLLFVLGISEDEAHLRETGVMLSVVLPVIGLLEDRIYRKSRERYLETRTAAERAKAGAIATPPAAPFDWMEYAGLDG